MTRLWLCLAGVLGATAIMIGAFATHGLSQTLTAQQLETIETGAHYHLIHAVALLAIAAISTFETRFSAMAGLFFTVGIVLFAGSLYILPVSQAFPIVIATPIGGTCFILGWACVVLAGFNLKHQ